MKVRSIWTIRNGSIDSVLKNLIATLEDVQKGNDEYASKGSGLLTQMETFETFFWAENGPTYFF